MGLTLKQFYELKQGDKIRIIGKPEEGNVAWSRHKNYEKMIGRVVTVDSKLVGPRLVRVIEEVHTGMSFKSEWVELVLEETQTETVEEVVYKRKRLLNWRKENE